jgi:hypothetical protein
MNSRFKSLTIASLASMFIMGCGRSDSANESKTVAVTLNRGTEIKLMLLEKLDSGGSEEGHRVPFVVCENVTDSTGKIVIPMGTPVSGEITQSRAAGALSSVINSPARLRMKLNPIEQNGGKQIVLLGLLDSEDTDFGFTRETMSSPPANQLPDSSYEDLSKKAVLAAITEIIEGSKSLEQLKLELSNDQKLNDLLGQLGYAQTEQIIAKQKSAADGINRVATTLDSLRRGNLSALSGGEATLVLAAIEELGGLASEVGDKIRGIFKGRNIRPAIGTRITVFVADDTEVLIRS